MPNETWNSYDPENVINILVAEDEEYNYLFLVEALSDYDVILTRALNGKMAVDLCTTNKAIQLVLMDIRMPVMDGYEATNRIKQIRPDLPIIAQTAFAMESDRRQAIEEGCDDYLAKPIRRKELIDVINKHIPKKLSLKVKEKLI